MHAYGAPVTIAQLTVHATPAELALVCSISQGRVCSLGKVNSLARVRSLGATYLWFAATEQGAQLFPGSTPTQVTQAHLSKGENRRELRQRGFLRTPSSKCGTTLTSKPRLLTSWKHVVRPDVKCKMLAALIARQCISLLM